MLNVLSVDSEPLKRGPRVIDPINKPRRVYLSRMYDCVIYHDFELREFPFDVQQLAVNLELKNPAFKGCMVRVLPLECRSLNTLAEWSILRPLSSLLSRSNLGHPFMWEGDGCPFLWEEMATDLSGKKMSHPFI